MPHILFALSLAIAALLYSSVGQAGGTGYVALMGPAGFAPAVIKLSALALNILVPAIGCARFYRAGLVTWRTYTRSHCSAARCTFLRGFRFGCYVGVGGYIGSWLGAFYFQPGTLRKILAFLLIAGAMRLIRSIVV